MEDLSPILQMLDQIINDRTVPRNIRKAVSDAKESIVSGEGPLDVRISNAIFILDEITNCLLYTSPSPRDLSTSRMPSSA